ncbi:MULTISPECIES: amidohydrolase family protein [Arsenicicoccus]|uniref:amidohydrolase family protein n=1 Tax=Arsenicicoccus TaxID=267408 RepID=UPI002579B7B6|nr:MULTISPECIES: amidohydrolase family protein [Actinomycetes]
MSRELLLRDVEVEGLRTDVRILAGQVSDIGPSLAPLSSSPEIVHGHGGALLPGLHDHHLHLLAMAAAHGSVDLGRAGTRWPDAIRAAAVGPDGWVRVVGYHERDDRVLDRTTLDAIRADVPVRVQHRSGALWVLNTRALASVPDTPGVDDAGVERDAAGRPTGRFWRRDELIRLAAAGYAPRVLPDLGAVQRHLRDLGITGVTDASPDLEADALDHVVSHLSSGPHRLRLALLTAVPPSAGGSWAVVGARKLVLHDHALPTPAEISARIRDVHRRGRPVAVHSVTRTSLVVALAALDDAGVLEGDRIEHGAVIPPELVEWIARLHLRVVTQPRLLLERGDDYLVETEPQDQPYLYPYAALLARGVRVTSSSDAPYADPDPWAAMRAARDRLSRHGLPVGDDEGVPPADVLRGYLSALDDPGGPPRRITVGAPADLCLLHCPLREALVECAAGNVSRTWVGGR